MTDNIHLDGYRPEIEDYDDRSKGLYLYLYFNGKKSDSFRKLLLLRDNVQDQGTHPELLCALHLAKSLSVLLKTDIDYSLVEHLVYQMKATPPIIPGADIASVITAAPTLIWKLNDDRYIRSVEGEFSEELSAEELVEVLS